jgi:5'-nucleotidase
MPYNIEAKVVVAVASSALFDLRVPDAIYRTEGEEPYREYQRRHEMDPLPKGVAFPFVRRLLSLNEPESDDSPVEVVFISRNDPDTGARLFNSALHYGLDISRGAFVAGGEPWPYIAAFNACLFLSGNEESVMKAMEHGAPAGRVLESLATDDDADLELRVALDFDGVIADDEAENVFKEEGMQAYRAFEERMAHVAHNPGPLMSLIKELGRLQQREIERENKDKSYKPRLKIAIITARNAPVHQRFVTTLRHWGIRVDQAFFLGGIEKTRILEIFKPHIFFDDQMVHLGPAARFVPSVHVPYGKLNRTTNPGGEPGTRDDPDATRTAADASGGQGVRIGDEPTRGV